MLCGTHKWFLVFPSLHERCKFCVGQLCLFLRISWGRGFSYRGESSLVNFLNVHRSYYCSLSRCSQLLSLAVQSYILMHLNIQIAVIVAKVLFKVYFQFQGIRINKKNHCWILWLGGRSVENVHISSVSQDRIRARARHEQSGQTSRMSWRTR